MKTEPTIRLKELREARGLLQVELAELMGTHRRTVMRWENGNYDPSLSVLRQLAGYFNVSVACLIGDEPVPAAWSDPHR